MTPVEHFAIYVTTGSAVGCLLALVRYGREAVRRLVSIDDKLDRK